MPHCCTKYQGISWVFHKEAFLTFKLMSRSGILVKNHSKNVTIENRVIGTFSKRS